MAIQKKYLKTRPVCKTTFLAPRDFVGEAETVRLVGDFNGWNPQSAVMKRQKTGDFSITLELPQAGAYQFQYLLDEARWCADPEADGQVPSPFGDSHNSLLVLEPTQEEPCQE
ncbi:MAG: isoamylase early set domain-containing protein [Candidatus Melainabacteria bacterium]|nr:isoamylase early set domain-containing protein [Candidatus Melainabacteria bacterium]